MAVVYLIPSLLSDDGTNAIPAYLGDAIRKCNILFVENERTARRYIKKLWKDIVIDNYEWQLITEETALFEKALNENKTIGIISEAGCPGIADPGQRYVQVAQQYGAQVRPLTGPNSIMLALMASGMNGQRFKFNGYLPINTGDRVKALKDLENISRKEDCTQIFIETPYRNNQLLESIIKTCQSSTLLCVAVDLTSEAEYIKTLSVSQWKEKLPDIHKKPAIFLLYAQ